jgi:hypothetical protein
MYLLGTSPLKIPVLLLSLVAGIFISLNSYSPIPMRKSRGLTMLPYMVDEIKKRVEIIEKWEEETE